MNTNQKYAKNAGLLYLTYIVVYALADAIGRSTIIVYGDAATTASNILASHWQFRIGFIGDLLAAVLFLLTAWALYRLLQPINQNLALLFLLLNLVGVAIQSASDLFLPASQIVLGSIGSSNAFQTDQMQALAMFSLHLYKNGHTIAQIFYGAWLFPLGYLVYKSGFLPKALGVVLMIDCATWLMTSLQFFLFPDFKAITYVSYPLGFIAEFGLTLGLLVMGVRQQKLVAVKVA